MKLFFSLFIIITFTCIACKEKYDPGIKSLEQTFLVVEGNLNLAKDSTIINLTRTFKLADTAKVRYENNASLSVEGNDGSSRALSFMGNGKYASPNLDLVTGNEYRLRIRLTNGSEYLSDYVKSKPTPDIDSIGLEMDGADAQLYINTDDPTGSSRYYRWTYLETWEIRSYYFSRYIYKNDVMRERVLPPEQVYVCWKYNNNTNILLANSTRLQEDIIYKQPLLKIPAGDDRLQVRYSIRVKQYALDKEAYDFYEIMKKNTEDVGSFFAPQPFEVRGNIHKVNDNTEPVIGYITASEEKVKRVFMEVPTWRYEFNDCVPIVVPDHPDSIRYYFSSMYSPYDYDNTPPFPPVYYGARHHCVDCQSRLATTVRPPFW
jgi:hypothetical protein